MSVRNAVVFLATLLATVGVGRAQEAEREPLVRSLRPEMTLEKGLFLPSEPITVRFTLFNPTDSPIPVAVTLYGDDPDGLSLPRSLVFGGADQPALTATYENETPTPLRGSQTGVQHPSLLQLAADGVIGCELDMASMNRMLRYSGRFRLEWRPFGDLTEPAVASFRVEQRQDAILITDYGKITFSLMYDKAPRNVENFLDLARTRFYDGKTINRIVPNFIMQGGSPDGNPMGIRPDGKLIPAEFSSAQFKAGTLAMARKPSDPDSASCQFFVSFARLPDLDGKYTVIGQASDEESLRTLKKINEMATTEAGKPIRPLLIRSMTLAPAHDTYRRSSSLELEAEPVKP